MALADDNTSSTSSSTTSTSRGINFFDLLPTEIVTLVLSRRELDFRDVVNFGATCKRYRTMTDDNELWKVMLINRWPGLRELANAVQPVPRWLAQCQVLQGVPAAVQGLLASLAAKCYGKDEVTYAHFRPLLELCQAGGLCRALTEALLTGILRDSESHRDLTLRYYARKALRYLRHTVLRKEWKDYFALPVPQQSLLEGAILFERWYRPCHPSPQDDVREKVEEIASQARSRLKPGHPSLHDKTQGVVKMTSDQCYEVLDAVNEVLYKELAFSGNTDDYYNERNSYMYISMVLTRRLGIPITLCILYEAVVSRLGVLLRPVNFPGHFILRWNYSSDGFQELDTNLFIDAFQRGKVVTSAEAFTGLGQWNVAGLSSDHLRPCQPRDVFRRMTANIMHLNHISSGGRDGRMDGIELRATLDPENFETVTGCVKYYIERRINYSLSLQMLSEVQARSNNEEIGVSLFKEMIREAIDIDGPDDAEPPLPSPKRRDDNQEVLYSVGMIMRHRRYHYSCVIAGWDPVCKLPPQWQRQMGVHQLPSQEKQPFYNVLVEDSSSKYAAQENLETIDVPEVVSHPEVGKHFQEYAQTHYRPNEQLARLYPDDAAVTLQRAGELYAN